AWLLPDQDWLDDAVARQPSRRLDHARVVTLRKHDALVKRARTGNQARKKRHCGIGRRHGEVSMVGHCLCITEARTQAMDRHECLSYRPNLRGICRRAAIL